MVATKGHPSLTLFYGLVAPEALRVFECCKILNPRSQTHHLLTEAVHFVAILVRPAGLTKYLTRSCESAPHFLTSHRHARIRSRCLLDGGRFV